MINGRIASHRGKLGLALGLGTILTPFILSSEAHAANLNINDAVEEEITVAHDANWEGGVNNNGTAFGSRLAGSKTVPGEISSFEGKWEVISPGSPDPGVGTIYFVDPDFPDLVRAVVTASWETSNPNPISAEIKIRLDSSASCGDGLGDLPAEFDGHGISAPDGSLGIEGQFLDPDTAAPVDIPSNLTIQYVGNVVECDLVQKTSKIIKALTSAGSHLKEALIAHGATEKDVKTVEKQNQDRKRVLKKYQEVTTKYFESLNKSPSTDKEASEAIIERTKLAKNYMLRKNRAKTDQSQIKTLSDAGSLSDLMVQKAVVKNRRGAVEQVKQDEELFQGEVTKISVLAEKAKQTASPGIKKQIDKDLEKLNSLKAAINQLKGDLQAKLNLVAAKVEDESETVDPEKIQQLFDIDEELQSKLREEGAHEVGKLATKSKTGL